MARLLDTQVRDVVARDVVTVNESATLETAARHMAARKVGAAVVVRAARNIGLLSERDVVERIGAGVDPSRYTAGDAMTSPLIVAHGDDTVRSVLGQMATLCIRHLPVLDAEGRLLGMVSLGDLLVRLVEPHVDIDLRSEQQGASPWFG